MRGGAGRRKKVINEVDNSKFRRPGRLSGEFEREIRPIPRRMYMRARAAADARNFIKARFFSCADAPFNRGGSTSINHRTISAPSRAGLPFRFGSDLSLVAIVFFAGPGEYQCAIIARRVFSSSSPGLGPRSNGLTTLRGYYVGFSVEWRLCVEDYLFDGQSVKKCSRVPKPRIYFKRE